LFLCNIIVQKIYIVDNQTVFLRSANGVDLLAQTKRNISPYCKGRNHRNVAQSTTIFCLVTEQLENLSLYVLKPGQSSEDGVNAGFVLSQLPPTSSFGLVQLLHGRNSK